MKIAWIGFIIELLILTLIKPLNVDLELMTIIIIGINIIFVAIGLYKYNNKLKLLFYLGYIIRILTMFWDIYARDIFSLPNSGGDSEGFLKSAIRISEDITLITKNIYGGGYSKFLGTIFHFTGSERMIGQYINVLLGISIVVIMYKIMTELKLNNRTIYSTISLITFFPNAIIFSGILLRENFIALFTLMSFYYFLKWYMTSKRINIIKSTIFLLLASSLHAGVIGIGIGYIFMYMFYKKRSDKLTFNRNTIIYFVLFVIIASYVYTQYSDVFMAKFSNVDEIDDVYRVASGGRGGSEYLKGLTINSPMKLLVYSPIKMFYFLISPIPFDWRGFRDILTFFVDSFLYLFIVWNVVKNVRKIDKKPIFIGLSISLLTVIFIFGIGISNAGTAMRHRHKVLSLLLIYNAMLMDWTRTKQKRQIQSITELEGVHEL